MARQTVSSYFLIFTLRPAAKYKQPQFFSILCKKDVFKLEMSKKYSYLEKKIHASRYTWTEHLKYVAHSKLIRILMSACSDS